LVGLLYNEKKAYGRLQLATGMSLILHQEAFN